MMLDGRAPLQREERDCRPHGESVSSSGSVYEVYASNFGQRTIGNFGSFVYLVNQIFGPGILAVPIVITRSGLLASTLANVLVCCTSCFAANKIIDAIRMMPGNANLEKRAEYADAVQFYCGRRAAGIFRVLLHMTLQSLNIASIVDTAMAFDKLVALALGGTLAFEAYPDMGFHFKQRDWIGTLYDGSDGSVTLAVTAGYLIVLVLCVPMGFFNIDDNIIVQIVSFIFLALLMLEFTIQCTYDIERDGPPFPVLPALVGNDFTQLLSVYVMSYSYGMLIMPWANEAKPSVRTNLWVWISGLTSCLGYGLVGTLLATCFPHIHTDNILSRLIERMGVLTLTKISAYVFAGTIILPGIPVFCITTRYDLIASELCGPKAAMFWGNVAPWLISWALSSSSMFSLMLTWTSLIAGSLVNFVIPLALFRAALLSKGASSDGERGSCRRIRWQLRLTTAALAAVSSVLVLAIGYQFH